MSRKIFLLIFCSLIVFCNILIHQSLKSLHISGRVEYFIKIRTVWIVKILLEFLKSKAQIDAAVAAEAIILTERGCAAYYTIRHLGGDISREEILMVSVLFVYDK